MCVYLSVRIELKHGVWARFCQCVPARSVEQMKKIKMEGVIYFQLFGSFSKCH